MPLSTYLVNYKVGDVVDIKGNGMIHKGLPHKFYHGLVLAIAMGTNESGTGLGRPSIEDGKRWMRGFRETLDELYWKGNLCTGWAMKVEGQNPREFSFLDAGS